MSDTSDEQTGDRRAAWPVMAVVGTGTLLAALAGSSVNLALPRLGQDLSIPIQMTGWVVQSMLLAVTVLLLLAGRIADLVGHRLVYLVGFLVFGASSAVCAVAQTFPVLIAARVAQGVGGAMVMATGPALLTTTFPPSQRGRALGMLGTATYLGLTIGPPVGGALISLFGWRSVFWLNVPAALIVVASGWFLLPRREGGRRAALDVPGAVTLVLGLPLLLVAVAQGTSWGWTSSATLACAGAGAALLVAFLVIETRSAEPLLRLELFRSGQLSGAAAGAACNYIALFAAIILLPFALEEGMNVSIEHTGLALSVQSVVMALVASPAGWVSDRIGSRWLATGGMAVLGGGLIGLSTLGPGSSIWGVAGWLGVIGLGTGVFISPNSSALMGAAPRTQQGVAGSVLAVSRNLGMLLGIAVAVTIFRIAGGQTGRAWEPQDFRALDAALLVAAGTAFAGALISAATGRSNARI